MTGGIEISRSSSMATTDFSTARGPSISIESVARAVVSLGLGSAAAGAASRGASTGAAAARGAGAGAAGGATRGAAGRAAGACAGRGGTGGSAGRTARGGSGGTSSGSFSRLVSSSSSKLASSTASSPAVEHGVEVDDGRRRVAGTLAELELDLALRSAVGVVALRRGEAGRAREAHHGAVAGVLVVRAERREALELRGEADVLALRALRLLPELHARGAELDDVARAELVPADAGAVHERPVRRVEIGDDVARAVHREEGVLPRNLAVRDHEVAIRTAADRDLERVPDDDLLGLPR